MRKKIILFVTFFLAIQALYGQAREKEDLKEEPDYESFLDRLYTGWNFALSFGTYTYIDVSPIFGYRITADFSAGVGGKYVYSAFNGQPKYVVSIYGGSVFTRYLFSENFLAHAEFELLNLPVPQFNSAELKRGWVPVGLIGGGYRQSIGGNSYFQIMALYDVINDRNNPYVSPFGEFPLYLRVGITIGL